MIPGEFEYHAPSTVDEAVALLDRLGDEAKILAGGHSLVPAMRFRLAQPAHLVDINGIDDLAYLREEGDHLAIGAMTRESALEHSDLVARRYPMLADAGHVIADPLVRNRGTVGGNLAHADPANDHPAVMLAYGATLVAQGPGGRREIAVDDFFTGLFESAMAANEILVEIRVPAPGAGNGEAYEKFERKVGDYAISAAAVRLTMSGNTCTAARVGLTNVSAVPMRSAGAEAAMAGKELTEEVIEAAGQAAAGECDPSADLRGSEAYKRDVTRVLVKRAIRKAMARAQGGAA
ncbi:MAG: xanthine dehydrogenase family protein subunit M [Gemmatimonadota bacterium]|nr:xanthine dehydrogenase family protein subunit M [Gemmatimonadota bacterium]MDH5758064.1 xanthine dehydrogenase family protein subunit M [Gemmatimonadota bacterium]